MGDLSPNFNRHEFTCRCGCGADRVAPTFLYKIQYAREIARVSFKIVSGCRCDQHNKDVGGSESSDHLCNDRYRCEGADIEVLDSRMRWKILNAAFEVNFRRIGIAKTFIHLGTAMRNAQEVVWLY